MPFPAGTRRLTAALLVSAAAGVGDPAVSAAQPPREDRVTGLGSTAFYERLAFDITSGPSGERPSGSSTVTTRAGPVTFTWTRVVCLAVQGNRATPRGRTSSGMAD